MNFITRFRTARLVADRLRAEDLDELCHMHHDPKVMATLGGIRSAEQTQEFLRDNLLHWDRYGYGLWMFRAQADNRFVGRGGLRHVQIGNHDEVEFSYALMVAFWGRGLATEIAKAIVRVAFEHLEMAEIVAFTLATNPASRRVMKKVGCQFERDIVHAGLPHVLYRINHREYVRAQQGHGTDAIRRP